MENVKERMRMIREAAIKGNVNSLDELLHEDPLILDRFIAGCFTETPLHIAAMLGRLALAKAILSRKPELPKELDFEGASPLHLATASGHVELVKELLLVNPEMCLAQNQDAKNPLHIAVIKDRIEVLKELVPAKPEAAQVPAAEGETILHLCVKHYRLEALRFLVENISTSDFVNSEYDNGFTVLHLALAKNQHEV